MAFKINFKPQHSSQKSFYGKADVREVDGKKVLTSYGTDVAEIKDGNARVYGTYSMTTSKHIKEFLLQNGFKAENSKQIMKDYGGEGGGGTMKVDSSTTTPKSTISSFDGGKSFKIDDKTEIVAEHSKTRNGFKHTAVLLVDGKEVDKSSASYLNRTWESYEYQSVVDNLIDKTSYISKDKKDILKKQFANKSSEQINQQFGHIGAIASLGEIYGKTPKEKNEWKLRMIKAGLGKGFSVPDDWDSLSEEEKGRRLDVVIKHLNQKK
jgi:hypothetical protein